VTDTEKLAALKAELVRQEIQRRNPVDSDVIHTLVADRVGIASDGRLIAIDPATGTAVVGDDAGYTKSLATVLDELSQQRPALFRETIAEETVKNPFVRGPYWNITEQMVLMSRDPARAEHLQYLASTGKN
jgi:hypothetical protein